MKRWIFIGWTLLVMQMARGDLSIPMTTIGNPGNAPDAPYPGNPDALRGAVSYVYQISTYEVSVAQYVTFLNAVASSDPHGLYREEMGTGVALEGGAFITRYGEDGSYTYSAIAGKENQPVRLVDFYSGLRLCNWLHNGQGDGDTETGSYDVSLGKWLTREPGATWVLPSNDEWHKAAYYNPSTETYSEYPNGQNTIEYPTDQTTPRESNFGDLPFWHGSVRFTSIGETTGLTAYGVHDMGGNVQEWTDSMVPPEHGWNRLTRGGAYSSSAEYLARTGAVTEDPTSYGESLGLRLVYIGVIPEPSTAFLMIGGLLLFKCRRKRRC